MASMKPVLEESKIRYQGIDEGDKNVVSLEKDTNDVQEKVVRGGDKNEETALAEATSAKHQSEVPDGGYGWVVVVAVFFVHVFVLGNLYSFGVFYPVYIEEFNENSAAVAWVGSIGACLMVGLGVWTGKWSDYYGNERVCFVGGVFVGIGFLLASYATELWHLYVTQGILAGIGYSLAFISGVSVVGQWFSKRRGLAVGIAVAGSGLGQFAISQITGVLLVRGGWRYALRILALICCVGLILCSLVIRRFLPCVTNLKGQSVLHYFRKRNFVLLFLGCLMNSLGMFMPYTHLTIYAEQYGISRGDAVLIISMVGISSAVGRIAVGWVADYVGKITMFQVCIFSGGASTLCWLACKDFGSIMAYGIIFGFFAGGVISLMPGVAAELYGIKKLGAIIGLLYSSTAIGNLMSAPIGGYLYDANHQNYTAAIAVAGCFLLSGMFLIMFLDLKPPPPKDAFSHKPLPPEESVDNSAVTMSDCGGVSGSSGRLTIESGYEMVVRQYSAASEGPYDQNAIPEEFEMPV